MMIQVPWYRRLLTHFRWWRMVRAVHTWATNEMDQFETFKFEDEYGPIYVRISRISDYPNSFDAIDQHGRPQPQAGAPRRPTP